MVIWGDYGVIKWREGAGQHALVAFPLDFRATLQLETSESRT